MTVEYEWDCETHAAGDSEDYTDGDVIDHYHAPSYATAREWSARNQQPGTRHAIVLVRDSDAGRSWAYVNDGKLSTHFEDGAQQLSRVPARFHAEVARA